MSDIKNFLKKKERHLPPLLRFLITL